MAVVVSPGAAMCFPVGAVISAEAALRETGSFSGDRWGL